MDVYASHTEETARREAAHRAELAALAAEIDRWEFVAAVDAADAQRSERARDEWMVNHSTPCRHATHRAT